MIWYPMVFGCREAPMTAMDRGRMIESSTLKT